MEADASDTQDGHFWVTAGGDVYVRSGAGDRNLSAAGNTHDGLRQNGVGTFTEGVGGNAGGYNNAAGGTIDASFPGIVHASTTGSGYAYVGAAGAACFGSAEGGDLRASGTGSMVWGRVQTTYDITASQDGAVAFGSAYYGNIEATGDGSIAFGRTDGTTIQAAGRG